MNFQEVLVEVKKGRSDNETSKRLGITRQSFSNYKHSKGMPSETTLKRIAIVAELPLMAVFLAAYAEKIEDEAIKKEMQILAS